jgi:hypothetical protein
MEGDLLLPLLLPLLPPLLLPLLLPFPLPFPLPRVLGEAEVVGTVVEPLPPEPLPLLDPLDPFPSDGFNRWRIR